MKVTDHIKKAEGKTLFSVEIIPQKKGQNINELYSNIDPLMEFKPPFIDVTTSREEYVYLPKDNGLLERKLTRMRPGTVGICASLKYKYDVDAIPHVLCGGFTKEETEDALIELSFLGIKNILAISGDGNPKKTIQDGKSINNNSLDLIHQIKNLSNGKYLHEIANSSAIDMCVGIGCYPEKHAFSNNFDQEIDLLKQKIAGGASYAVTQMFFDNSKYFAFVERCRKENITIPIIPGIKILDKPRQIDILPKLFNIELPDELHGEAIENIEHIQEIGTSWAIRQSEELINAGAPIIHYYLMEIYLNQENVKFL